MRTIFALTGAAVLLTWSAVAGPEVVIKQRARELSNQNNVRQGVPPPTQPGTTPNADATPAPQPQTLARLQADLAAIKTDSPPTADQKQRLAKDLTAAALGAAKPSTATASKLAEDLSAALAIKSLPSDSRARLVQELDAVLNPVKYPNAKMDGIFADIQAIFQANDLPRKEAAAIADDVRAIWAEIQKGGA